MENLGLKPRFEAKKFLNVEQLRLDEALASRVQVHRWELNKAAVVP